MSSENQESRFEIEIKIRLKDRDAFALQLPELGFRLKTPETMERNVLFDTPEGLLRQRRQLLRIREYGSHWVLTHKAPAPAATSPAHKVRIETETRVEDGRTLAGIFEQLGFQRGFTYEKLRTEWSDGEGHLVIDVTPIGDFAELEGSHEWIDRTAGRLGIASAEYLPVSYGQLFLDWKKATGNPAENMTFAEVGAAK